MVPTWAFSDFQSFCPLLAYVGAPVFNAFVASSGDLVNSNIGNVQPNNVNRAGCYMLGHILEISGYSPAGPGAMPGAGPVKKDSVNGIETEYAVPDITPGALEGTFYGRAFLTIAKVAGLQNRPVVAGDFDPSFLTE